MSRVIEWIKEHKFLSISVTIIVIAILVFGIPLLIGGLFWESGGISVKWDAHDYLLFYGSFLSFLGTVFLGFVALKQNNEANRVNKELMNLNKRMLSIEEAKFMPIIDVTKALPLIKKNKLDFELTFYVENIGKSEIKYCTFDVMNKEGVDSIFSKEKYRGGLLRELWLYSAANIQQSLELLIGEKVSNEEYLGENNGLEFVRLKVGDKRELKILILNCNDKVGIRFNITDIFGMKYSQIMIFELVKEKNDYIIKNVQIATSKQEDTNE